jgi:hypothetical protein
LRKVALIVAALALGAVAVPAARADGDPASDYLITQDVFLPLDRTVPADAERRLLALVQESRDKGYVVKVALIASRTDLGAVTALWRKPQPYADFLGQELYYLYRGPLLVVMPNGYGIYKHGLDTRLEKSALAALPAPEAKREDVATAALRAVQALAALQGVKLAIPTQGKPSSTNSDRLKILTIALTIGAVIAGLEVVRRMRRRPG